jgi:hypothetical protein
LRHLSRILVRYCPHFWRFRGIYMPSNDLAGFNDTIGSLSNGTSGAGNVHLGAGRLTTGANNASTTFNGFFGSGAGGSWSTWDCSGACAGAASNAVGSYSG